MHRDVNEWTKLLKNCLHRLISIEIRTLLKPGFLAAAITSDLAGYLLGPRRNSLSKYDRHN
jgi:hypothetical protein